MISVNLTSFTHNRRPFYTFYLKNDDEGTSEDDAVKIYDLQLHEKDDFGYQAIDPAFGKPDEVRYAGDKDFRIVHEEYSDYYYMDNLKKGESSIIFWERMISDENKDHKLVFMFSAESLGEGDYLRLYVNGEEITSDNVVADNKGSIYLFDVLETFNERVDRDGPVQFEMVPDPFDEGLYITELKGLGENETSRMTWNFDIENDNQEVIFKVDFEANTEKESDFFRLYIDDQEIQTTFNYRRKTFQFPFSGSTPELLNPALMNGINLVPGVINVGATSYFDNRLDYSQYGPELHFVAPSGGFVDWFSQINITTTDRSEEGRGYNPQSAYTHKFNGTSSACPVVSGAMAMVLSANPELTKDQIVEVLKETADKVGDNVEYDENGFHIEYGYGRINLGKAVKRALVLKETTVKEWEIF